jgi:hypothetical protein
MLMSAPTPDTHVRSLKEGSCVGGSRVGAAATQQFDGLMALMLWHIFTEHEDGERFIVVELQQYEDHTKAA